MNEETLFAEALKRRDPAERAAFLEQGCGADTALRQRIEELLRAHEQVGGLLDKPAATVDGTSDAPPGQWLDPDNLPQTPPEGVGSRIHQYKLLQQIGEGGMGVVFMAEQQEPVRRLVALKVIKAGMDSAQVIARFEQERQALALMDHPNIAKVLDAGTTASGRPYFVMELVKGIPITKYCDEQRLSPKQRLELFVPVCQAIQHAHQKGIIHRDIKPSNVLIAAYDGKPVPKVIDFGVAKATGGKLTERTLFTGLGGIVGTLEYMSPEQAEFNALDIDTRSDVYSLGVLLYELLTGSTPLSRKRIKDAAIMEVLRLIREEEPPNPSMRLSESKDSLASVSAQRQMEPAGLVKAMRGEVDWMVMKALDKDRTRRYETANGLARDIQRYLSEEPVEAGPPSARYRLRKLAWRYRRGLATAAALLLLLIAGAATSTALAVWALDERNRALTAEAQAKEQRDEAVAARKATAEQRDRAVQAESKAKKSVETTGAVLRFFRDNILAAGRPKGQDGGLGREVKLIDAVNQAREKISDSFTDRPLAESVIRSTLGTTYMYLGDYSQGIRQYERALALDEAKLGPEHANTLTSLDNLALAYQFVGRTNEAIRLHERTLKRRESKLGLDHRDTLSSRYHLAVAYRSAGRSTEAIRLHEQVLKLDETKLGPDHPDTLMSREGLASSYISAGRTADAVRLYEQNLKQSETKLGADHPHTLLSRGNLANAYRAAGRTGDAIRLGEQNLRLMEAKLGADHPDTLRNRVNLASAYFRANRIAESTHLFEQALKQMEAKLGADHPDTLRCRNNLAVAYDETGRPAEAIRLYEQILKQKKAKLGPDHPSTLVTCNNLAQCYLSVSRTAEAIRLHEQILKQREAKLGAEHPDTLRSRNNLADAFEQAKEFAKAEPLLRTGLELTRKRFGAENTSTAFQMAKLGLNLLHQHQYAGAETLLRPSLKIHQTKLPESWGTFITQSMLGEALLGQKKYADAEPLLLAGYQGMKQREAKMPPQGKMHLREALERLVQLYEATGNKNEVEKWRKELAASQTADKK